jgi:hypothetical protein
MGSKYTVRFMLNGLCPYKFEWQTNYLIKALWWLVKLRVFRGYKIITLEIRVGYTPVNKCKAGFCVKECWSALDAQKGADHDQV